MAIRIFLLGRPGSGKTTAANYLTMRMEKESAFIPHNINDYTFLLAMAHSKAYSDSFILKECGGFDVKNFFVLDEVLRVINANTRENSNFYDFITVEFARDDYSHAFDVLFEDIPSNLLLNELRDTYFVYLEADVETCLERIHKRMACPNSKGDHSSLSDDKFRDYYGKDNWDETKTFLKEKYQLPDTQFPIIKNYGNKEEFKNALESLVENNILPAFCVPA